MSFGRSKSSKSLIITGDNHIGHIYALASPLRKLKPINDFWEAARDKLWKERANIFVINGEPIDGDSYKDIGAEHWTTDMAEQLEVANEYLECFKMDAIGMTRGSNYHTTRGNTSFETLFAKMIKCAPILEYSPYGKLAKRYSHRVKGGHDDNRNYHKTIEDILQLKVHDTILNIMHHTSSSSSFAYLPTTIANPLLKNMIITGKPWTQKDAPDITIRSHTHSFVLTEYGNTVGFVAPAWKIFDRFQLQRGMTAATIGLIEIIIEPNNEFHIHKIILPDKLYPKIDIAVVK